MSLLLLYYNHHSSVISIQNIKIQIASKKRSCILIFWFIAASFYFHNSSATCSRFFAKFEKRTSWLNKLPSHYTSIANIFFFFIFANATNYFAAPFEPTVAFFFDVAYSNLIPATAAQQGATINPQTSLVAKSSTSTHNSESLIWKKKFVLVDENYYLHIITSILEI